MNPVVKSFVEGLNNATTKDAVGMMSMLLIGPSILSDADDKKRDELFMAMFSLANIGMMAVLGKAVLIPLLVEGATPNDDTTLEDDLLITSK